MAIANEKTIDILNETIKRLKDGKITYSWGHAGHCNCGILAQVVTGQTPIQIYFAGKYGMWSTELLHYCATSGSRIDLIISSLLKIGFTIKDISNLEMLWNREILNKIGVSFLTHNNREHVILYLETWAEILSEELTQNQLLTEAKESLQPRQQVH